DNFALRHARGDFTGQDPQTAADLEHGAGRTQFQELDKCRVGQAIERREPFLLSLVRAMDVLGAGFHVRRLVQWSGALSSGLCLVRACCKSPPLLRSADAHIRELFGNGSEIRADVGVGAPTLPLLQQALASARSLASGRGATFASLPRGTDTWTVRRSHIP